MTELIHPHPNERALLLMKMAADRTRLEAGARLAGFEGQVNRDQFRDRFRMYGAALAVGAIVFALVMRRSAQERRPASFIARMLSGVALFSRLARYLPQLRYGIERARAQLDERRAQRRREQDQRPEG